MEVFGKLFRRRRCRPPSPLRGCLVNDPKVEFLICCPSLVAAVAPSFEGASDNMLFDIGRCFKYVMQTQRLTCWSAPSRTELRTYWNYVPSTQKYDYLHSNNMFLYSENRSEGDAERDISSLGAMG